MIMSNFQHGAQCSKAPAYQKGASLIELMISLALGLLVVGAVTMLFVNTNRTQQETEKTSQQIENGRYATQLLLDELRLAGYYGEFNVTALSTPGSLPDPSLSDGPSLAAALMLPVQGYDNGQSMPSALTTLLADRRADTDVLVVRRASTCLAGTTGCEAADVTQRTYFQTSLCATQLAVLGASSQFLIGTDTAAFNTTNPAITGAATPPAFLAKKDCLTAANLRSLYVRIFFIANNNSTGDGIPTLKVAELGAAQFNILPLTEGIEQLQLEYGVDTDANGTPNTYTTSPASVALWRQVVSAKIHLLARNTKLSSGFTDTRSYVLGLKADGTDNTFAAFNDGYKRHVYTTTVRLNNVAGKLE